MKGGIIMEKEKFYNKDWFLWVMLIFFAPVGIYLLWRRGKFNKVARISLSVFFGFIFLTALGGNDSNNNQSTAVNTAKPTTTVTQTPTLTPEEQAKKDAEKKATESKLEAERVAQEKARVEKEAQEKAETEKEAVKKAEEDRVAYDTGITYNQIARTPDQYKNKKVKFTGKVIQVMESENEINLRIAVNDNYDNVLLVAYLPGITSTRVLENDHVTIKGVSQGLYTYKSTLGGNITIPLVLVNSIAIN
jgi:uncharacterized membrane protein YcgQ (UPF0703/DUF1980 family)